ncbi:helix-turn-helix domain-containing protein [Pantoea sp. MBD-2R]|uniref:helix-turn-helix domain-containing protein n=1 Tax=Pantoea sp. MBD-2R TaxID=3141540 RepID=UPI00318385D1
MAALSRRSGLSSSTLSNVLYRKWPRGEKIVASHLNIPPWVIWPSRYKRDAEAADCAKTHQPIP